VRGRLRIVNWSGMGEGLLGKEQWAVWRGNRVHPARMVQPSDMPNALPPAALSNLAPDIKRPAPHATMVNGAQLALALQLLVATYNCWQLLACL
jgi:hypothetical protein